MRRGNAGELYTSCRPTSDLDRPISLHIAGKNKEISAFGANFLKG